MTKVLLVSVFLYFFIANTQIDDNKYVRLSGLAAVMICFSLYHLLEALSYDYWYYEIMISLVLFLVGLIYIIFYNNDVFSHQMKWYLPLIVFYVLGQFDLIPLGMFVAVAFLASIYHKATKSYLYLIYLILTGLLLYVNIDWLSAGILILFHLHLQMTNHQSFTSIDKMQKRFLANQYEEIKDVYLNMRGWRHDYHNHLQAMKAYLSMDQVEELKNYLLMLEEELDSVDRLVKTGNVMMDAICNSKITIMKKKGIDINFKAHLPENLAIKDVDLCIIVSNLLDNAIESCMRINREDRFIRVYARMQGAQLYMSIQNSAEEDLDFNQRHYISTKRGNHGLGMKRVQFLVDKYAGYLNLQNEPGIFASEVTLSL